MSQLQGSKAQTNTNLYDMIDGRLTVPRYTTTERDALANPAAGEVIYNETTNKLNMYNGASWEQVTSA